eukprot:Rhum_TRINITY_DN12563_c0_g1::Rhum_TRINITY_DN12563_c0_g1_i1::g.52828::m.52828
MMHGAPSPITLVGNRIDTLQGRWTSARDGHVYAVASYDVVCETTGGQAPLGLDGVLMGVRIIAETEGMLHWSDGDVWTRDDQQRVPGPLEPDAAAAAAAATAAAAAAGGGAGVAATPHTPEALRVHGGASYARHDRHRSPPLPGTPPLALELAYEEGASGHLHQQHQQQQQQALHHRPTHEHDPYVSVSRGGSALPASPIPPGIGRWALGVPATQAEDFANLGSGGGGAATVVVHHSRTNHSLLSPPPSPKPDVAAVLPRLEASPSPSPAPAPAAAAAAALHQPAHQYRDVHHPSPPPAAAAAAAHAQAHAEASFAGAVGDGGGGGFVSPLVLEKLAALRAEREHHVAAINKHTACVAEVDAAIAQVLGECLPY